MSKNDIETIQDKGVLFLLQNYEARRNRNRKYSLRAFSKFLGIDHSLLSKAFSGKTLLSQSVIYKCLAKLSADSKFIEDCIEERAQTQKWEKISDEQFELISDWTHNAILELLLIPKFKLSPASVSKILGIEESTAKESIKRLIKYGYIKKTSSNYVLTNASMSSYSPTKTSLAKRLHQTSMLQKSMTSLMNVPFESRDHSSVSVAVARKDMMKFKKRITEVRRQLIRTFQSNKDFDDVYCLQISFFPLTQQD